MGLNQKRVSRLFQFLQRNRRWNLVFQKDEHNRALAHCDGPLERLMSLLHTTVNTQSQPSIELLSKFWRHMDAFRPQGAPLLLDFTRHLKEEPDTLPTERRPWSQLFNALKAQPGWGPKTTALFVKSAVEVHRGPEKLHFFLDADLAAAPLSEDEVYLPVDSVITYIFQRLGLKNANFQSVNNALLKIPARNYYSTEEMLVWDDLWYWGFFTQVSSGQAGKRTRTLSWNADKFWCQPSAPKSQEAEVQLLAEEFIRICRGQ